MSIAVVYHYCSRYLHVQELRGRRYFDKEVEVFNNILLNIFFSLNALFIHLLSSLSEVS